MITKKYASNHNQFTNYNKIHKPKHTLHAYRKHQPVPSTQALKTNTQLLSSSRTLPQLLNLPKTNLSNLLLIKMMTEAAANAEAAPAEVAANAEAAPADNSAAPQCPNSAAQ